MIKFLGLFLLPFLMIGCAKNVDVKKDAGVQLVAAPTVDEQLSAMGKMCTDTAERRKASDSKTSLYKRLGGKAKIEKVVFDWVALHYKNDKVAPFFAHSDAKAASAKGAAWLISVSGGPKKYRGPTLAVSHAHRKIGNDAFLAAGADVAQAMKANGHSEENIQDLLCLLGSHRASVVSEAK